MTLVSDNDTEVTRINPDLPSSEEDHHEKSRVDNRIYFSFNREMEFNLDQVYCDLFGSVAKFKCVKSLYYFNVDKYEQMVQEISDLDWEPQFSSNVSWKSREISTNENLTSMVEGERFDSGPSFSQTLFINKKNYPDILLDFSIDNNSAQIFAMASNDQRDILKELVSKIEKLCLNHALKPAKDTEGCLNLIVQGTDGFRLKPIPINSKFEESFLEDNYNSDFEEFDSLIGKAMSDCDNGLILLHGDPGTGKTNYIRYLINTSSSKKKMIYIPPETAHYIASPNFINFMLDNRDSILILEDAEGVLLEREVSGSQTQSVANLLNLTDGLLGSVLRCLVISTFNCDESKIDKALLRKGRLLGKYEFKRLTVEKTNALLEKVFPGKNFSSEKGMTLSEIYNHDQNEYNHVEVEKRGIGFLSR